MGLLLGIPQASASGDIALLFTDLTSGPNTGSGTYADGCFVTLYGTGFGSSQGSGGVTLNGSDCTIERWAEADSVTGLDVIVVQPNGASTGNFVVTNNSGDVSNGIAFTVDNTRNIREADGDTEFSTEVDAVASNNQEDIIYVRAGTYTDEHGVTSYGDDQVTLGGDHAGMAIIGYPGETVNFHGYLGSAGGDGGFRLYDGVSACDNFTIANVTIVSGQNNVVFSGFGGSGTETGPVNQRCVNIDASTDVTGSSMTGSFQFSGDGGRVLGCYSHDDANTTAYNNKHHVYIQVGADDCEVGWSRFYNCRCGHVIQVHTDGAARQYDNIRIHDNLLQLGPNGNCRGTNVSGTTSTSTVDIWNNVFDRVGGLDADSGNRFSVHISYTGICRFYQNTIIQGYCDDATDGMVRARGSTGDMTLYVYNNIIDGQSDNNDYLSVESGAVMDTDLIPDSNVYTGITSVDGPTEDGNALDDVTLDLVDTTNATWASRDYRPETHSILRDHALGDTSAVTIDYDRLGIDRDNGVRADIGAHERQRSVGSIEFSGTVDQDYDRFTVPINGSSPANIGSEDFTIEMWVYADSSNTDSGPNWYDGNMFLDNDRLGGTDSLVWTIHDGVPQVSVQANGSTTNSPQDASTDIRGAWAWLVMTRDESSGAVQFYVNGTREINATMPSGDLSWTSGGNAKDQLIEFGGEKHTQGTPAFEGEISEIRFSNTIRYSGSSITVPTEPLGVDSDTVAYWDFSEGTGDTVFDRDTFAADGSVVFNGGETLPSWVASGPYD